MKLALKVCGCAVVAAAVGFGWPLVATAATTATAAGAAAAAQDRDAADPEPVVMRWVGTTGHAWGAWVAPGASVEDWVEQAIPLCGEEEFCEVNVFEGPEHVTHEYPVPEANRAGLKWVLRYRHNETPRVVVEEMQAEPGHEPRTWTFDR